MFRQTLRSLAAHKRRFLATAVAVVLGVAFMSGTLVLTNTMKASFDGLFSELHEGTDAYVRAGNDIDGARDRIDLGTVGQVAAVPGVVDAAPVVEGYAQIVGSDGKSVDPATGSPALGLAWIPSPVLNPYEIVEGHGPQHPDDVVIDRTSAEEAGYEPGDTVTVLTQSGSRQMTLSGIVSFGETDRPVGATVAAFTLDTAMALLSSAGRIDAVAVEGDGTVSREQLAQRIAGVLPTSTEVLTGDQLTKEHQDDVREGVAFMTTFLLAFALISLFVGAFIIHNTFSIVVAQRTKELALLRSLGAGRAQIMTSVMGESVVVGAIAAAVGLGAGLGVAQLLSGLLSSIGLEMTGSTVITAASLATPFVVGVAVCLASSIMPARKATRVPPIAAMRDVTLETNGSSRRRTLVGSVVTATGVAALLTGLFTGTPAAIGVGALAMIFGVRILGPVLARPAARLLGGPAGLLRGMPGRLARDNAARNPKRTAATASALMIGVALVGFASIVAASSKEAVSGAVDDAITGDLVLNAGQFSPGVSPSVATAVASIPGVEAVSPVRYASAKVDGEVAPVIAYDPTTVERVMDLGVREGALASLGTDGLAVQSDTAEDLGWTLGDPVTVQFPTGAVDLRVVALYDEKFASGDYIVGIERFAMGFPTDLDQQIIVRVADGADVDDVRRAVEQSVQGFPTLKVMDRSEFIDQQAGQIDQFLALIYALLGLAIVIALVGIVNTLSLSIHERTRELGLLRAIGMSRRQVRSSVRWEAVIISTFGTLLGLTLGLVFGTSAVSALGDTGIETTVVPFDQLVVIAALGAVAGVIAAALPARRATRLDVLAAINAE